MRMLNLSYEYKLKPTPEQIREIERTLVICRQVWNYALRERKDWLNARKCRIDACSIESEYIIAPSIPYPNYAQQCKSLTAAKEQYPELKTVNAQMLQQVLRKLETAFVDMQRKGMGFPRFKNRYRMRSFVFPQMLKNCCQGNYLKLPQLGPVELIKSREIPQGFVIKQARIIRRASGYFVILSYVCWKRGIYLDKVNKDYTSQVCPNCDTHTGRKELSDRIHSCPECGYTTHRDVAAAQVIRNRGVLAVGRIVSENACGDGLTGTGDSLVKNLRSKKKSA